MKRLLLPIVIGLLLISANACMKKTDVTETDTAKVQDTQEQTPSSTQEPASEPVTTVEFTTEGLYKLFGVMNEGLLVESAELQMESNITLNEGGTGTISLDSDIMDITEWKLDEDIISLTLSDGGQADAKLHDGILELDIYGDGSMILYYAQEGADISGYEFLTLEEVREQSSGN